MIKRILSGVLMSALVAGAAMGASAAPASASEEHMMLHADVDAWQVTLQDGHAVGQKHGDLSINAKSVGHTFTNDVFTLQGSPDGQYLSGAAEYQIVMLGKPTGYWIKAGLVSRGRAQALCEIFASAPSAGGTPAEKSQFTCSTKTINGSFPDARFAFHVGLNRDAEASGSITPTGTVSLGNGFYSTFGLPYAVHGTESVDSAGATTFDTVLREGDTSPYGKQARTEFAYQIYDKGAPTPYWVAGLSTNYRGWSSFSGDGRCGIYQRNPLADGGELDQRVPLRAAPYACTSDGSYVSGPHEDGHGHFFVQFTVSAKK